MATQSRLPPPPISPSKQSLESLSFPEPPPPKHLVGPGFSNNGMTCYCNAVLQCVTHTMPLLEKLVLANHHLSCDAQEENRFCAMCALTGLIDQCFAKPGLVVSPWLFTDNLNKISPDFQLGNQEDAHEFLRCLLDSLHNCCLDPSFRDQPSALNQDSLIKQVYGGCTISQLRCCECGHVSNTSEPVLDFSLETDDADTVEDALISFTKVEKIEETITCEGCKAPVLMEKQIKIDQAPTIISLHLKRFQHTGLFVNKIDKFVQYPLELDLKPFLNCPKDDEQMEYELYAVLVHAGRAYSGHYYSFIRTSPATWHLMDDERVTKVSEDDVLNENAYIVFYIKKGSASWFSDLMDAHMQKVMLKRSPTSVLNQRDTILSPSSHEESSPSTFKIATEKDGRPGPNPDALPVSINHEPEGDNSPGTFDALNDISNQNGNHNAMTDRFQNLPTKRRGSGPPVADMTAIFHDEPLENDDENRTPVPNVVTKGSKLGKSTPHTVNDGCLSEPIKNLMRSMPSYRRSGFLAYLPPENNSSAENSPLITRTHPPITKKRKLFPNLSASHGKKPSKKPLTTPPSTLPSQSLSPRSVKRGLFIDDDSEINVEFESK